MQTIAKQVLTTRKTLSALALGAAVFWMPLASMATDYYWTNASGDGVYTNKANWNPYGLPQTTDYTPDVVILGVQGGTSNIVTRLPYANGSATANLCHLRFDTAGWTFTSAITIENLKTLKSYGSGTNVVNFYWNQMGNQAWTVGPGNTLYLAKKFYCRGNTVTLTGGGALRIPGAFDGYSSVNGIKVQTATLRIEAATPATSTGGVVWMDAKTARFQLKTTVVAAKALIGPTNKIRDNTGNGLQVTDIGGGYVEVTVKPLSTVLTIR
jgi:hypothetical protein